MVLILKVIISLCLFAFPSKVHAIVILPAIILVPLVKLIAVIVGAFSLPIASGGMFFAKITKKYTLGLLISFLLIVLVGVVAAIVLRLTHPNNPWF